MAKKREHREAMAMLEEMANDLGVPLDAVRELAARVTGCRWEDIDLAGAEHVAEVLSELLERSFAKQAAHVG